MKATIYFNEFRSRVKAKIPDNFSNKGLEILFDFLNRTKEEDWLLDIGEIAQDYRESSFEDFASYYSVAQDREAIRSRIEESSYVIGFTSNDTVIYGTF
jgi:replication fork clamp-binding protein CrfC